MTKIAITLCIIISWSVLAGPATLECESFGKTVKVSKNVLFDEFFDNCQEAMFSGDVCFTGKRAAVIELLHELDSWDILGDEYSLTNVWYYGKRRVQYDIYDGPNESVMYEHLISRCN